MCKTLIVEDNPSFRQLLKEILDTRFPSMEIIEDPDGKEVLQKVDSLHPDLIFMDIQLPGENGLQLAKKIKGIDPNVTIIILTSYDIPEYREAAFQSGANHFITKNSSTREFLALVESILSGLGLN
jgi:DNA-binding NarL/FixJ family response regulator